MPRTQPTPRRRRRPPPTPRAPPSPTNRLPGQGAVQLKYRRLDLHTYEILYRTEETHWWHAARRRIVLDWIEQRYPGRSDLSILDAGCGTGLMLQQMSHLGHAEGVDIAEQALDFCRKRGHLNVRAADVLHLPFGEGTFDFVTALDVLEHLDDDAGALVEWHRVLK